MAESSDMADPPSDPVKKSSLVRVKRVALLTTGRNPRLLLPKKLLQSMLPQMPTMKWLQLLQA